MNDQYIMKIQCLQEELKGKNSQLQGEIKARNELECKIESMQKKQTEHQKDKMSAKLKLEFVLRKFNDLQDKMIDFQYKNEQFENDNSKMKDEIEQLQKYNECPICMECIGSNDTNHMVAITTCGHRLCYNCEQQIQGYDNLPRHGFKRCPICQKVYDFSLGRRDVLKLY